jgi:ADP-ribose pyrophosphatase
MNKISIKKIKENIVYENKWVKIYDDIVIHPDGKEGTYLRITYHKNPKGVVIIPEFNDHRILLLRSFRYAIGKELYELPRGTANEKEAIEEAALRELKEETNFRGKVKKVLGSFYPDSAIMMTEVAAVHVLIEKISDIGIILRTKEAISGSVLVDINEIKGMVLNGKIQDGFSLCALNYFFNQML